MRRRPAPWSTGAVVVSGLVLAAGCSGPVTLDAPKLAHALSGFKLPPEVALQPGAPEYRAGDHELMSTVFVGEAHPPKGDPDNMFTVKTPVPGEKAAGPAADTGCKVKWPA